MSTESTHSDCPLCDPARPMPGSVEMDKATLSCMMQAPGYAVPLALQTLTPADFYTESCSLLFDLITARHADRKLVDPVSITECLYERNLITRMGGAAFVSDVYTASPNPAHVEHYAEQVKIASRRRQLARLFSRLTATCITGDDTKFAAVVSAGLRSGEIILAGGSESVVKSLKDVVEEFAAYFDKAGTEGIDPAVSTGLAGLDAILRGGVRREYIVIGGRTGHGKTLLAMQLAGRLAEAGRAGLVVGYEMSNLQILMRDLARETHFPLDEIMGRSPQSPQLAQAVTRKLTHWLQSRRVAMIDSPTITFETVAAHARHLHRQGMLDYIVLDYLQLVPLQRVKGERRDEVLAELSANVARLRKELGCTIIAPVQLNDDGLVRDSRAILHPAECFLRIEMGESENEETGEIEVGESGILRVLKNRFGPVNKTCPVRREGQFQTFTDRKA